MVGDTGTGGGRRPLGSRLLGSGREALPQIPGSVGQLGVEFGPRLSALTFITGQHLPSCPPLVLGSPSPLPAPTVPQPGVPAGGRVAELPAEHLPHLPDHCV